MVICDNPGEDLWPQKLLGLLSGGCQSASLPLAALASKIDDVLLGPMVLTPSAAVAGAMHSVLAWPQCLMIVPWLVCCCWVVLLLDAVLGLMAFTAHHFIL